jgi:hypothetical protein
MPTALTTRRHLCSDLVTVSYPDRSGVRLTQSANLEEIGDRSAALLLEQPVRRGAPIRFTCQGHDLRGTVRSCTPVEGLGYFAVVLLAAPSRWSERWFTPRHLLKLDFARRAPQAIPLGAA